MAKSPEEMKAAMIAGLPEKTGKSLEEWLKILRATKLSRHKEFVELLEERPWIDPRLRQHDRAAGTPNRQPHGH